MGKIVPINIRDEMKRSYIDYAMSVIVGRALPDVRDGLKPVHRRILFAMNELGMTPDKPFKKNVQESSVKFSVNITRMVIPPCMKLCSYGAGFFNKIFNC